MDAPEHEGGPGLARHGRYGVGDVAQGVAVDQGLLGRGRVVALLQLIQILHHLDRDDPGAADVPDHQGAGDPEEVGAGMGDVVHRLARGQGRVGLLDDVVDVDADAPLGGQPGAQGRLMRKDLPQKPPAPIWIDSKHARPVMRLASPVTGVFNGPVTAGENIAGR